MVTFTFVSGSVPVHALRSSAKDAGVRVGAASVNVAGSMAAAAKSGFQSTGREAAAGDSTCGGIASKRSSRPFESTITFVIPVMLADFALLSQDIFKVARPELPKTVSVLTVVNGRVVHSRLE